MGTTTQVSSQQWWKPRQGKGFKQRWPHLAFLRQSGWLCCIFLTYWWTCGITDRGHDFVAADCSQGPQCGGYFGWSAPRPGQGGPSSKATPTQWHSQSTTEDRSQGSSHCEKGIPNEPVLGRNEGAHCPRTTTIQTGHRHPQEGSGRSKDRATELERRERSQRHYRGRPRRYAGCRLRDGQGKHSLEETAATDGSSIQGAAISAVQHAEPDGRVHAPICRREPCCEAYSKYASQPTWPWHCNRKAGVGPTCGSRITSDCYDTTQTTSWPFPIHRIDEAPNITIRTRRSWRTWGDGSLNTDLAIDYLNDGYAVITHDACDGPCLPAVPGDLLYVPCMPLILWPPFDLVAKFHVAYALNILLCDKLWDWLSNEAVALLLKFQSQFGVRTSPNSGTTMSFISDVNGISCRHAHTSEIFYSNSGNRPQYQTYEDRTGSWATILFLIPLEGMEIALFSFSLSVVMFYAVHSGHRLVPRSVQYLVMTYCLWINAHASLDENVVDNFEQRRQAEALQEAQEVADRWEWVRQHIGITRPPPDADSELTFHRTSSCDDHFPIMQDFGFNHGDDAIDCVQAVEAVWSDLGPYDIYPEDWLIFEVHRAVISSQLSADRSHWILTSRTVLFNHPGLRPVMTEVRWHSRSSCEIVTLAMFLTSHTHKLQVLRELGLFRACSSTHICLLEVNGEDKNHAPLELQAGAFLLIRGHPVLSEAIQASVAPQAMIRPRTSFDTQEGDEATDTEVTHPVAADPQELPFAMTIYRPLTPPNQHPFLSVTTDSATQLHAGACIAFWPDLGDSSWHLVEVHPSYYTEFNHIEDQHVRLLWDEHLANLAANQVLSLLTITWIGMTYSAAMYLPSPLTRTALLQQTGLTTACDNEAISQCTVKRNGMPLIIRDGGDLPGQFVHIDLTAFPRHSVESIVDDIFGINSAASGFEYIDDPLRRHFLHIARGDAAEVVSQHTHESFIQQDDHALYWILCAWVYGFLAGVLALHLHPCPAPRRTRPSHRPPYKRQLRGFLLLSLLVSARGIQLRSLRISEVENGFQGMDFESFSSFQNLPPPGNPHPDTELYITKTGDKMIHVICEALSRPEVPNRDLLPDKRVLRLDPLLPIRTDTTDQASPSDEDPRPITEKNTRSLPTPFSTNDWDDLLEEWPVLPLPTLDNSITASPFVQTVLDFPFVPSSADTEIYIYTDGSFAADGPHPGTTWAIAIFALVEGHPVVRDWYADYVTTDWYDEAWIGATQNGIRSAETTAIIYACLFSMQAPQADKVLLFSDANTILNAATGLWKTPTDDLLGKNLRATYLPNRSG